LTRDLFAHHLLLVVEVLLAHVQRPHALRLQPEGQLHAVRGHVLVVVRVVEARRAVEVAAVGLHVFRVLELLHVRRALEHHVLEEVGEPGAALGLDAEADAVVDGDGGHGRGVILGDHELEAVGE
jgi:hypothetical protein